MRTNVVGKALQKAKRTRKGNLSELNLFRQMMQAFSSRYGAVVVEETHQHYVHFVAGHTPFRKPIPARKEISDILIVAYSPSRKVARETFLQAKVARNLDGLQSNGDFIFTGENYQYYLLSERPLFDVPRFDLQDVPVLRDAILPSIGSYGVFYEVGNNRVDFAYQPADKLICHNIDAYGHVGLEINQRIAKYDEPSIIPDLQYTLSIDEFEYAVTHMLVGSPVTFTRGFYYAPYDYLYFMLRHNLHPSSDAQRNYVMSGLDDFGAFLEQNRELFRADTRREGSLERYKDLMGFIPQEDRFTRVGEGRFMRNEEMGEPPLEEEFCQGPISMILINVDKIGEK